MKADKLKQLLELCLEKDLNFDFSPNRRLTISKCNSTYDGFLFRHTAYLYENITDLNNQLDYVINTVKNYQS